MDIRFSAEDEAFRREVAAWLNHPDLKVLTGRLMEVHPEHIVVRTGADQSYFIPYDAIVAVRPQ